MHVSMYVYMYKHVYIYIYVYIYMNTHTHTLTPNPTPTMSLALYSGLGFDARGELKHAELCQHLDVLHGVLYDAELDSANHRAIPTYLVGPSLGRAEGLGFRI